MADSDATVRNLIDPDSRTGPRRLSGKLSLTVRFERGFLGGTGVQRDGRPQAKARCSTSAMVFSHSVQAVLFDSYAGMQGVRATVSRCYNRTPRLFDAV